MKRTTMAGAATALALLIPAALAAQESFAIRGDAVAVYNLAGEVEVVGVDGGQVNVRVTRGGADGGELDVQVGEIRGRQTLRVIYPASRILYRGNGWGGNTTIRVRRDGTWGDDWGGDRVRVSSRRSGLDAHADLRIEVPRGQEIAIYVAVGRITASNVNGRIALDTHSGGVDAQAMSGSLFVDTGSGAVDVRGMDGELYVDTGSGSVEVSDVVGERLGIDTGSGGVDVDAVEARSIEIDTGSGSIDMLRAAAREIELDTGSGSVSAELMTDIDRLVVDTGSGSVTLRLPEEIGARLEIETGSGGIEVEFPVMATRRARDELQGEIGDGQGRIEIDTGSGGVRLLRR